MNIDYLLDFIDKEKSNDLIISEIPFHLLLEIIKNNNLPLIKLIFSHSQYNYLERGLGSIFSEHRRLLCCFSILIEDKDFLLEGNINKKFVEGLINVYNCLKTDMERKYYLIDILYGARIANNINLVNVILDRTINQKIIIA